MTQSLDHPGRIYVASSWRNLRQPFIVSLLRGAGLEVYDFRNPQVGDSGFAWEQISPDWENWSLEEYFQALCAGEADEGYRHDFEAMEKADTFVMVHPSGRSSHLELGWAAGQGKNTAILFNPDEWNPKTDTELMVKMVNCLAPDLRTLLRWLGVSVVKLSW